jgi:hypothetical protein
MGIARVVNGAVSIVDFEERCDQPAGFKLHREFRCMGFKGYGSSSD